MKKVFSMLIILIFFSGQAMAQDKLYLLLEFMKVTNDQESAYGETERFWENIHKQRIQNGDIMGWDLWALMPGGEDQGYQYMTATLFDNPVKMFQAGDHIMEMASKAYPDLSEEMMMEKFNHTAKSRNLSERLFVEIIKRTNGNIDMEPGIIAAFTFMKAENGQSGNYEKAETEVFYPVHQKLVDKGIKSSWGFGRILIPYGSDATATHITANMYSDFKEFVDSMNANAWEGESEENIKKANEGRQARDLKWVYLGELIKMVR